MQERIKIKIILVAEDVRDEQVPGVGLECAVVAHRPVVLVLPDTSNIALLKKSTEIYRRGYFSFSLIKIA